MDKETKITIETYDRTVDYYANKTASLQPKKEIHRFVKYLPKGARILDVGCGPGRDSKTFSELGFQVLGIDLSANMLKKARQNAPKAKFRKMDLRQIKLANKSLDAIWADSSILHIKKKKVPAVLADFNRILKADGLLFIIVKLKHGKDEEMYTTNRPRFYSYFTVEELGGLIESAGFRIDKIYTWNEAELLGQVGRPDTDLISCFARKL